MKLPSILIALTLTSLPALLTAAANPAASFNIDQPTMAPGAILQPGSYSIRVIDHLQDRFLLSVEGTGAKSVFIAVPVKSLTSAPGSSNSGRSGVIKWTSAPNGNAAMRGFRFENTGSPLEFVYPKAEAVSLAKANGASVLAVDPASEGHPAELSRLSNSDMQIVTLWTLTPERVGGQNGDINIAASKYQGSATSAPDADQAGAATPSKPTAPLKRLPHTAGTLPLIFLAGLGAALGAGLLRLRRTRVIHSTPAA